MNNEKIEAENKVKMEELSLAKRETPAENAVNQAGSKPLKFDNEPKVFFKDIGGLEYAKTFI